MIIRSFISDIKVIYSDFKDDVLSVGIFGALFRFTFVLALSPLFIVGYPFYFFNEWSKTWFKK